MRLIRPVRLLLPDCAKLASSASSSSSTRPPSDCGDMIDMYEGQLMKKIFRLKLLSLTSSAVFIAGYSHAYIDKGFSTAMGAIGFLSIPFVTSPLAIGWLFRRYVLRLQYDPKRDLYLLHTYGMLLSKKEITFTASEACLADVKNIASTFKVRGRHFYLNDEDLKSTKAVQLYKRMLKLDEPSKEEIKT